MPRGEKEVPCHKQPPSTNPRPPPTRLPATINTMPFDGHENTQSSYGKSHATALLGNRHHSRGMNQSTNQPLHLDPSITVVAACLIAIWSLGVYFGNLELVQPRRTPNIGRYHARQTASAYGRGATKTSDGHMAQMLIPMARGEGRSKTNGMVQTYNFLLSRALQQI